MHTFTTPKTNDNQYSVVSNGIQKRDACLYSIIINNRYIYQKRVHSISISRRVARYCHFEYAERGIFDKNRYANNPESKNYIKARHLQYFVS